MPTPVSFQTSTRRNNRKTDAPASTQSVQPQPEPQDTVSSQDLVPPITTIPQESNSTVSASVNAHIPTIEASSGPSSPPGAVPATRSSSPESSVSSSSDSSLDFIMSSNTSTASWVNNGAGRLPTINARHLDPLELFNVFACVEGYYINKDMKETDSQKARNAFFSCFTSPGSVHFFAANRARLLAMNATDYKHAIYRHVLGDDWESLVYGLIFSTKQAAVEDRSFEVLLNIMGAYNSLLTGTPSAVDDSGLQGALYASFTPDFTRYLEKMGVKRSLVYKDWLVEVKKHDIHFRKFVQPELDELVALRAAASSRPPLAPAFSQNAPRSSSSTSRSSFNSNNSRPSSTQSLNYFPIPKWSEVKTDPRQVDLYHKGKCCFHCRTFFTNHQVGSCKFEATPLEVPYCPLTEADISWASDFFSRFKKSITLNALLKRKAPA
ncbi:hypothetical protein K435DRAFT_860906 [Dendrothele bispora CBS 962.96]|uniref:Uncharacterized protein n=1 Tax=Dendrothele bispora (strain CBS 962.96) TaxID=1314807 RepID=A0A4S8LWL1_DENBC|nr:hypothetical protein K435DRAFT_860906 [Dendrothele bispora CBS 962.96]